VVVARVCVRARTVPPPVLVESGMEHDDCASIKGTNAMAMRTMESTSAMGRREERHDMVGCRMRDVKRAI